MTRKPKRLQQKVKPGDDASGKNPDSSTSTPIRQIPSEQEENIIDRNITNRRRALKDLAQK